MNKAKTVALLAVSAGLFCAHPCHAFSFTQWLKGLFRMQSNVNKSRVALSSGTIERPCSDFVEDVSRRSLPASSPVKPFERFWFSGDCLDKFKEVSNHVLSLRRSYRISTFRERAFFNSNFEELKASCNLNCSPANSSAFKSLLKNTVGLIIECANHGGEMMENGACYRDFRKELYRSACLAQPGGRIYTSEGKDTCTKVENKRESQVIISIDADSPLIKKTKPIF
jgi:hypothetical protein